MKNKIVIPTETFKYLTATHHNWHVLHIVVLKFGDFIDFLGYYTYSNLMLSMNRVRNSSLC